MKKRSVSIISLITLFSINLISAQFSSGYNRFSPPDLLRSIDPQTMILGALFLLAFTLIYYALSRVFKDSYGQPNKTMAGIIAFIISALIIYGINQYGFDMEGLFYGIGLSSGILYLILPLILTAGVIFLIWKFKQYSFLIIGLLLILLTLFTDIFYEQGLVLIIGVIMLLIGLIWWWKRRGRENTNRDYSGEDIRQQQKQIGKQQRRERQAYKEEAKRRGSIEKARRQAYKEDARRGATRPTGPGPAPTSGGGPPRGVNRMDLARKLGIPRLQKEEIKLSQEYQMGLQNALGLNKKATSLGWTKAGSTPRAGETPEQTKRRAREASDMYKKWYRQYSRNIQLEKQIRKIQERIAHLQKRLS